MCRLQWLSRHAQRELELEVIRDAVDSERLRRHDLEPLHPREVRLERRERGAQRGLVVHACRALRAAANQARRESLRDSLRIARFRAGIDRRGSRDLRASLRAGALLHGCWHTLRQTRRAMRRDHDADDEMATCEFPSDAAPRRPSQAHFTLTTRAAGLATCSPCLACRAVVAFDAPLRLPTIRQSWTSASRARSRPSQSPLAPQHAPPPP